MTGPMQVSAGIPGWVTVLLILGAIGFGLATAAFTAALAASSSGSSVYRQLLVVFLAGSVVEALLSVAAIVGIIRGRSWARTMALVAAVAMALSGAGLLLALPVGIGVVRSRG